MDVELYVYDLSQGLARQFSLAVTGVQIDAIYHTAIVLNDTEYFFGQGIHRKVPGSTHHGRPMKVVSMGKTSLPLDVIEEYVQSLEAIYTPESYDLFLHNCNNFTQDLSMFLVGKSIPSEISSLPETFLQTPIGQMLRGQIDQSMRTMTQAPDAVAGSNVPKSSSAITNGHTASPIKPAAFINAKPKEFQPGHVHNVSNTSELDKLLRSAESTCAVIFFTSSTCPPCKMVYPVYDELAEEAGSNATLIKVDVGIAYDVGMRYQVRATPTFITFLKGKKDSEWSGANGSQLRGNVRLLIQMAQPQHPHSKLTLPSLQTIIQAPALYTRMPPLDKLVSKLDKFGLDPEIQQLVQYLNSREKNGLSNAPLPNLDGLGSYTATKFHQIPLDIRFAFIDLIRIAAADPRVSSFLVAEANHRIISTLIPPDTDYNGIPYNIQAVTLQLACNLFGSNVFQEEIINNSRTLRSTIENLASTCLLAKHHNARSLSAALVYNLAAIDHNERMGGRKDILDLSMLSELEAALVEAVVNEEESKETLHAMLLALGLLLYGAAPDTSIWELCGAMDVRSALSAKAKSKTFTGEPLLKEVGEELLGKGGR